MLLSFAGVIVIAVARSKSEQEDELQVPLAPDSSSTSILTGSNAVMLGVTLTLCHAWLFSGVGVISRRLQRVHFTELMLH